MVFWARSTTKDYMVFWARSTTKDYMVFWARSTTKDYIRAYQNPLCDFDEDKEGGELFRQTALRVIGGNMN